MEEQHRTEIQPSYIGLVFWPLITTLGTTVFAIILDMTWLAYIGHAITIVAVIAANWHIHSTWESAAVVGAVAGVLIGIGSGITRLIVSFHSSLIFNLFTEGIFTGVLYGLSASFLFELSRVILEQSKK